jgi:cellulose synthase/poly-beta-1,6-N-acetylglucosamine synthase-like glycosyltransferase
LIGTLIAAVTAVVLATTSILLFIFGANLLYLTVQALRLKGRHAMGALRATSPVSGGGVSPTVCIQVPIYNERYVAERVIDAVCAIEWPRDRLEVQVLDDSDDDTTSIIALRTSVWRRRGVKVSHVRRQSREGFKAGALAYGLGRTNAELIAIFDADFVPAPDFLRRIVGAFADSRIGFVQARWGHLDEDYSLFTRLQAMAIDFHFLVEQAVRSSRGYFTNFTGTAGVWRREAIEDAGGWSARTLTEDLDLSYRAQLRGWKAAYEQELVVPEELPVSIDAYRRQQSRWATGSFQSAFELLGPVLRSEARAAVKFQATVHLLAYGVGPVMLVQLACYPVLLLTMDTSSLHLPVYVSAASAVSIVVGIAPWLGFIAAQTRRGRSPWSGFPSVLCQVVGAAMSLNTLLALFRALRPGGDFVRTPKHHIVGPGQEWRNQAYVRTGDPRAVFEAVAGVAVLALVPIALAMHQTLIAIYSAMFAVGFLAVTVVSLVEFLEVATLRGLHAGVLFRARRAAPVAILFGLASALFWLAAQMPEPFEDGYGHWLVAANFAATGQLRDPLFAMEDTWLPAYHVLAASVLAVFGLWHIDLLKTLSALLGLVTAACVYRMAPNARQSRIAVVLLILNPVFIFTSGSAVVEPLLTAVLVAGALAAMRGYMKLAALLAALACLTSTKAWIWVAAAAGCAVLLAIRSRAGRGVGARAIAWAAPALALLILLQLGFAPVTHSMARGSLEVVSATARGSIAADWLGRIAELASTFGLAALPLFVFGALGAVFAVRHQPARTWTFLYMPAFAYLAVVFGLVVTGVYTGSHRYLYPALPALALLAASALDRQPGFARLGAVAASGGLAIAFLPVFFGFGNQDAGLVAAGRAAATSPGTLLTDSPVAAYYSGKSPSLITGSLPLPDGQTAALGWLRDHGVTALVLEDISYYRATEVFSELASGKAELPFASLGLQTAYQAGDGKPAYVYRLLPPLSLASTAEGKTAALAKGMTMGVGATGEGMGFGVPIVRYPDGWVYSRTSTTDQTGSSTWRRTFELDEIGGDAAHRYAFVPIASRGAVEVTYTMDGAGLSISVKPLWLAPGYMQIGILNEQSAAFNDFAAENQPPLVDQSFGRWMSVEGGWARLRSQSLGVEWSLPALPGAQLFAGRELAAPGFDWAGLDYMFGSDFAGAAYRINVGAAR